MSTAKRSRLRQSDGRNTSPPPASKRLKTTKSSHVPSKSNLDFLVDADARSGKKLTAKLTNGLSSSKSNRVDESHAVVAANAVDAEDGGAKGKKSAEVIDISSGEESSDDDDIPADKTISKQHALNGHMTPDEDADGAAMEGVVATTAQEDAAASAAVEEEGEASFGDMLRARHPEMIDVQASFADPSTERSALIPANGNRGLTAPSGTSLGTVLTQALKTNDRDLLESCFQVNDMQSVRGTIERLASPLVVPLLQKLAERIHKRPGRTQKLMVWVQWSLVVHGGYLAGQPDLMKRLRSLSQVVRERASGLQSLLHLKGKLDLLWAQLDLQKRQRKAARIGSSDEEGGDHVIYIDGANTELWSDEEELNAARNGGSKAHAPKLQSRTPQSELSESGDESDSDEDMPNGLAQESDDEDDEAEEDEGLIDVEAEETDDDDGEDDEEEEDDSDDVSESEDDEEDEQDDDGEEITVKAPKPATLNRKR